MKPEFLASFTICQINTDRTRRTSPTAADTIAESGVQFFYRIPCITGIDKKRDPPVFDKVVLVFDTRNSEVTPANDSTAVFDTQTFIGVTANRLVTACPEQDSGRDTFLAVGANRTQLPTENKFSLLSDRLKMDALSYTRVQTIYRSGQVLPHHRFGASKAYPFVGASRLFRRRVMIPKVNGNA